jgi:hypothetical protein
VGNGGFRGAQVDAKYFTHYIFLTHKKCKVKRARVNKHYGSAYLTIFHFWVMIFSMPG